MIKTKIKKIKMPEYIINTNRKVGRLLPYKIYQEVMAQIRNTPLFTGTLLRSIKDARETCPDCGYKGAIKWNPYNRVNQCHNCGEVIPKKSSDKEVVVFT